VKTMLKFILQMILGRVLEASVAALISAIA
jgi:hypothetical protein